MKKCSNNKEQQPQLQTNQSSGDHQKHSQENKEYGRGESQQENLNEVGNEFIDQVESLKLVDSGANHSNEENGHKPVPGNIENNDYTPENDREQRQSSFNLKTANPTPENNILDEIEVGT